MSKKQVILFVGQDITAQLIMNRVVKDMIAKGVYEPVLLFPKGTHLPAEDAPELVNYAFFDKQLLQERVYPFLSRRPSQCAANLSPESFREQFGIPVENIDDVNDPDFVAQIEANSNIACAISIRCTQLFRRPIWTALKKYGPFLNLHSGLLPDYRGVMPTLRRMFDIHSGAVTENDYGMTLHQVDPYDPQALHKGIDTGKIIEVKSIELNPEHSGYQATVALADAGADALINTLTQLQNGYTLRGYPQANETSAYYTFPTRQELQKWKDGGLVLVRPDEVITTLVNAFSKAGTPHGDKLTTIIRDAIIQKFPAACGCKDSQSSTPCGTGCAALRAVSSTASPANIHAGFIGDAPRVAAA